MPLCDLLIVNRIPWDWFCSNTVARRNESDSELYKLAFAIWRKLCQLQDLTLQRLPIAMRIEPGLDPAHRHFHFLIGGLRRVGTPDRMKVIAAYHGIVGWRENSLQRIPNGTMVVRLYDGRRGASAYLSEILNKSEYYGWTHSDLWLSNEAKAVAYRSARAASRSAIKLASD